MFIIKKREIRVGKENNPTERENLRLEKQECSVPSFSFFIYHEFHSLISSAHFSIKCICCLAYLAGTDFGMSPISTSVQNRAKMI